MSTNNNKASEELIKKAMKLRDSLFVVVSSRLAEMLQVAVDVIVQETIKHRPGFNNSDDFAWQEISKFHLIKGNFSKEHQAVWDEMYAFLMVAIGHDVIAQKNKENNIIQEWSNLGAIHDFVVVWSMNSLKDAPPADIKNQPYPTPIDVLHYTANSGWGLTGSIELPKNPTYFDVWSAANTLVKDSGDVHHVFLESINHLPKLGGAQNHFYMSLGS